MTTPLDLAAIRARAEAATYCGGDMQELADDALALLAEVKRVGSLAKKWYGEKAVAEAERDRLRAELAEIDRRIAGARGIHRRNWLAEVEVTLLTATLDRVRKLADDARPLMSAYGEAPGIVSVSDLLAAIEGTDS